MWTEEDIDTPCTRYGERLCSGCLQRIREMRPVRCYRSGRAVARIKRLREALSATAWVPTDRPLDVSSLPDVLKRAYGPGWEGPYRDTLLAKELERYEWRRYVLLPHGKKPRKWDDVCRSLGLRIGKSPLDALIYADRPLFGMLPRDAGDSFRNGWERTFGDTQ